MAKKTAVKDKKPQLSRLWYNPIVLLFASLGGFITAQIIAVSVVAGLDSGFDFSGNTINSIYSILAGLVFLGIVGLFLKLNKNFTWRSVGLRKPKDWRLFWLIPAGFVIYFVLTLIITYIAKAFLPGFEIDQAQDVGIANPSGLSLVLAAIGLILITPLAEEIALRGLLFGGLRKRFSPILAAVITSLVFGLLHGQWNVGLDTFTLSLVLCFLYQKTGSLWASILLHAGKNALAFILLFIVK